MGGWGKERYRSKARKEKSVSLVFLSFIHKQTFTLTFSKGKPRTRAQRKEWYKEWSLFIHWSLSVHSKHSVCPVKQRTSFNSLVLGSYNKKSYIRFSYKKKINTFASQSGLTSCFWSGVRCKTSRWEGLCLFYVYQCLYFLVDLER